MKLVFMMLYAIALATGGVFLLWKPFAYQNWILRSYEKNPKAAKYNPFLDWMKSDSYLIVVRLVGVLCLIMAILLLIWGIAAALR
jgi:hypothetical protein